MPTPCTTRLRPCVVPLGLVFEWLEDLGGLEAMAEINRRKAETLYGAIDNSTFYGLAGAGGLSKLDERAVHVWPTPRSTHPSCRPTRWAC